MSATEEDVQHLVQMGATHDEAKEILTERAASPNHMRALAEDHAAAPADWDANDWIDWERDAAASLRAAADRIETLTQNGADRG